VRFVADFTQRIEKRDGKQVVVTFKDGKEVSVEPHIRPISGYLPGTSRAFVAGRAISEQEIQALNEAERQRILAEGGVIVSESKDEQGLISFEVADRPEEPTQTIKRSEDLITVSGQSEPIGEIKGLRRGIQETQFETPEYRMETSTLTASAPEFSSGVAQDQNPFAVDMGGIGESFLTGLGLRGVVEVGKRTLAPAVVSGAAPVVYGSLLGFGTVAAGREFGITNTLEDIGSQIALGMFSFGMGDLATGIAESPVSKTATQIGKPLFEDIPDVLRDVAKTTAAQAQARPLQFGLELVAGGVGYSGPEILRGSIKVLRSGGRKAINTIKSSRLRNKVSSILRKDATDDITPLDVEELVKAYRRGEITQSEIDRVTSDLLEGATRLIKQSEKTTKPFAKTKVSPSGRGTIETQPFDIFGSELDELAKLGFGKEPTKKVATQTADDVLRIDLGSFGDDVSKGITSSIDDIVGQAQTSKTGLKTLQRTKTKVQAPLSLQFLDTSLKAPAKTRTGLSLSPLALLGPILPSIGRQKQKEEPTSGTSFAPLLDSFTGMEETTDQKPTTKTRSAQLPQFDTFVASLTSPAIATALTPAQTYFTPTIAPPRTRPRNLPSKTPSALGGAAGRAGSRKGKGRIRGKGGRYTPSIGAQILGLTVAETPQGQLFGLRPLVRKKKSSNQPKRTKKAKRSTKKNPILGMIGF